MGQETSPVSVLREKHDNPSPLFGNILYIALTRAELPGLWTPKNHRNGVSKVWYGTMPMTKIHGYGFSHILWCIYYQKKNHLRWI